MKQFLYLDTDIVNSIIAHAEKGIITQRTIEASETKSKNKRKLFSRRLMRLQLEDFGNL